MTNKTFNQSECCILGSPKNDSLWYYKSLLNVYKIYYCNKQTVLKARSYRNLILSRIKKPTYY